MVRRIVLIALVTVLLAAGCHAGDATGTGAEGADLGDVRLAAALTPFDGCDALLDHLRTEGLDRVGPYGLDGDGYYVIADGGMAGADDATASTAGGFVPETLPSAPVTTVPTSGTNTQEAFVDEPDGVKVADGRLYVVDDTTLRIIDVSGDEPVARGTLELPSWGQEILVVGDRVLAIGGPEEAYPIDDVAASTWAPYSGGGSILTEIDVSDPDAPTVAHTLALDSGYLSARLVGETARVVVSAAHPAFPFVYPSDDSPQSRVIAEEANRRVIEDATIDDWLPDATLDGEAVDALDCATVQRPAEFSGFGFLSVLTVDMAEPLTVPPSTTVLADGRDGVRAPPTASTWPPAGRRKPCPRTIPAHRPPSRSSRGLRDRPAPVRHHRLRGRRLRGLGHGVGPPGRRRTRCRSRKVVCGWPPPTARRGRAASRPPAGSPCSRPTATRWSRSARSEGLGRTRADLLGPLRRRHRLRRHLPSDRSPLRGRPERPHGARPCGASSRSRATRPTSTRWTRPPARHRPGGRRQRRDHRPPGLGLRRHRPGPSDPGRSASSSRT